MKIAFVSSGNSVHVKKLANELVKRGHKITLYTLRDSNKLISEFDSNINIIMLPFSGKKGYYLNYPFLKLYLKRGQYDLINSHYASGFGTLSRIVNIHPIALAVFGSDVYDYPFKNSGNMKRIKKNLDNADVITSTSHVMVNQVKSFYDSNKKIYVTPFGVDIKKFKKIENENKDEFVFGIVKKIEHKYGIDILIKAFAQFLENNKKVKSKLLIYGRGSAEIEYRTLVKNMRLEKRIIFKGFIQNELVVHAFSEMDVACFPSVIESESFGVAAVEAMACEVPVIVSDASGFTEVVENHVTGIIVAKNSVKLLCEAMETVYKMTKDERMIMGKNGRSRVEKLYNFEENIITYENAINKAVSI